MPVNGHDVASMEDMDRCGYLLFQSASEPSEHALRLLIGEAKPGEEKYDVAVGSTVFPSRTIQHRADCRLFEVRWMRCTTYMIRDEAYVAPDAYDQFNGRRFVLFSKSRLLDLTKASSIAELIGPVRHWGIYCLNHVIDVVSNEDPIVQIVKSPK
jgi:hypothetical protein